VDFPGEYGVSARFNVADLSPYLDEDDELPSLMTNSFQEEGDDRDHVHAFIMSKELQEACQGLKINGTIQDGLYAGTSNSWLRFPIMVA